MIQQLTSPGGTLSNRIATNNDYNRNNFAFPNKADQQPQIRNHPIDYNLSDKHHLSGVWNYQVNSRDPDGLNGTLAILPGTGTVLGSPELQGPVWHQLDRDLSHVRSTSLRRLTNEGTFGIQGGTDILGSGTAANEYGFGRDTSNLFLAAAPLHDESLPGRLPKLCAAQRSGRSAQRQPYHT